MTILYSLFPNHIDHNVDMKAPMWPQLPGPSGGPNASVRLSDVTMSPPFPVAALTVDYYPMIMARKQECGFVARPRRV